MQFLTDTRRGNAARVQWALTAALLLSSLAPAAGQTLRYSGSMAYSGGSYFFEETTHSFFLNNGIAIDFGRVEFSVNLPLVYQNSGLVSLVGGVPVPTGGEDSGIVGQRLPGQSVGTQGKGQGGSGKSIWDPGIIFSPTPVSGSIDGITNPILLADDLTTLGDSLTVAFEGAYSAKLADPLFQGSVDLYEGLGFFRSFGVRGGVKPAIVGLDSGVGTGEWDFGGGASVVLGSGSTFFFGDLGYWRYGDLPELELQDGFNYSGGFSRSFLNYKASLMLTLMGAQPLIETAEAPLSAGVGLGYVFSSGRMVNAGLNIGLSESTPDLSLSLGWSVGG